jgi:hypothetical protein
MEAYGIVQRHRSGIGEQWWTPSREVAAIKARVAELEDGHSAIFPYVSDLDKPIGVLIRGLGARYDARGVELVEQRQRIAELEAARLTATADTIRI